MCITVEEYLSHATDFFVLQMLYIDITSSGVLRVHKNLYVVLEK